VAALEGYRGFIGNLLHSNVRGWMPLVGGWAIGGAESGWGQGEKGGPNEALQAKAGGVRVGLMQGRGTLAAASRWPITPKWVDRQTGLITCRHLRNA
jgi:hypothetical protein